MTPNEVLATALADGYTGIRVAADNTRLVERPEQLAAWIEWEQIADAFMDANPVTGLCAFDLSRTEAATLRQMRELHDQLVGA